MPDIEKNFHKRVGPWKTQSLKKTYENPWISVTHREVITPAGTPGIYGVVHFKNKAIGIVPVTQDGHLIMVKQFRYPIGINCLEIPAGGCPKDEDPLLTAQRELEEETGYKSKEWQLLVKMHLSNSITDEQAEIYLARNVEPTGKKQLEDTEADLEVCEVSIEKALEMIDRFEITDSLTVAGILRVVRFLRMDDQ